MKTWSELPKALVKPGFCKFIIYVTQNEQNRSRDIHWISSPDHCLEHSLGGLLSAGRPIWLLLLSHAVKQLGCDLTFVCKYSMYWSWVHI